MPEAQSIVDRYPVIDIDTHICEPEDLWTSRVSSKWGDLIPHVEKCGAERATKLGDRNELGVNFSLQPEDDIWIIDGKPFMPTAYMAWAGQDSPHPKHAPTLAEAPEAGSYDAHARLKAMDEMGVYAMLHFPNLNISGGNQHGRLAQKEPQLALECVRAYNDFLTEWCSADPKRLLAQMALPLWNMDECLKELDRAAQMGHKAVLMSGQPDGLGLPWLPDRHWDPLWAAAEEAGLPIAFHIAADAGVRIWPGHDNFAALMQLAATMFMGNANCICDLIFGGVCHRFPKLNFVSVESGIGYLPFLIESMDWQFLNQGGSQAHPEWDLKPSEYFKRQIYGSFWFEDHSALRIIDLIQDNVLYETDYPHPTSISPGPLPWCRDARTDLEQKFAGFDDGIVRKVLHDNAARIYHLD